MYYEPDCILYIFTLLLAKNRQTKKKASKSNIRQAAEVWYCDLELDNYRDDFHYCKISKYLLLVSSAD